VSGKPPISHGSANGSRGAVGNGNALKHGAALPAELLELRRRLAELVRDAWALVESTC
jgi:hypothetical protein